MTSLVEPERAVIVLVRRDDDWKIVNALWHST
jgi:hypothetical protein